MTTCSVFTTVSSNINLTEYDSILCHESSTLNQETNVNFDARFYD